MANKAKMTDDDFNEEQLFGPEKTAPAQRPRAAAGNPLAKYFRAPGMNVRLPTGGKFLPKGSVEFTMSGEVPVFPMRAADELLMKSPDALMSGYAIEKMLESCVPAIHNPREISTPDLDVLLLAVRAASYGDKMEIETTCPKCGNKDQFECSLGAILGTIKEGDIDNSVRMSPDVIAYVKPYTLDVATRLSLAAFQEARRVQAMDGDEIANQSVVSQSFRRLSDMNLQLMAESVMSVAVPEGVVTDRDQIIEFVNNAPSQWTKKIEDRLRELNTMGVDKGVNVQCSACNHEWRTEIEFDPTSFFGQGS